MADGRGQGVRGVVGARLVVQAQDVAHHVHDLALVRRAGADNGLLDLHGGVLPHREPRLRAGHDGHAARLRRGDGALHVLAEIDVLDGELRRAVAFDDRAQLVVDPAEPRVDGLVGPRGDAAVGAGAAGAAPRLDHSPARVREPGVDAEYDHRRPLPKTEHVMLRTLVLF